jgi:hypothetical protein
MMQTIINLVSNSYGIPVPDILSERKRSNVSRPRLICYWLCRHRTEYSLPRIARLMQKRDHRTISKGIQRIDDLRQLDPGVKYQTDTLLEALDKGLEPPAFNVPQKMIGRRFAPPPVPEELAQLKARDCMTCGAEFLSEGAHHRMCTRCRANSDETYFTAAVRVAI